MLRKLGAWSFAVLAAALLLPGAASGQGAFGRILLTVYGPDGKTVEGVTITVTCDELPEFKEELTTNKKGRATINVIDATKRYNVHVEYDDYEPFQTIIKPQIRQLTSRDITLGARQSESAGGGGEAPVVFTPAERIFNEGVEALRAGDMATAKAKFTESLEKDPKMAEAHSALAGVYLEEKDYAAALAEAQQYHDLAPDTSRGYRLLYDANQGLGNEEAAAEALATLKEMGQSAADTAAMVYNEGVAAYRVADYAEARQRFQEALELKPDLTPAVLALVNVYLAQKSWADVAAMAERLLELEPGNPKGLRARYDAYRMLGDQTKLVEARAALAASDPTALVDELYNKGVELFQSGDVEAAQSQLEEVVALAPDHAKAHYRLALCYVNSGDNGKAKAELERFLELAPDDPEAQSARDMISYLQ